MATFYGTETYSIDDKGRIVVPVSMRKVPGRKVPLKDFVLVGGLDGCIWLYAQEDWVEFGRKLQRLADGEKGKKGRDFARVFLHGAKQVTVDGQGRITMPPSLIDRAGLGKDAVLHGLVGRIEIWAPDRFQKLFEKSPESLDATADDVLRDL